MIDQPNDSTTDTKGPDRTFRAEWDEEGVFFYQAYNDDIADWSLKQTPKVGRTPIQTLPNDLDQT